MFKIFESKIIYNNYPSSFGAQKNRLNIKMVILSTHNICLLSNKRINFLVHFLS